MDLCESLMKWLDTFKIDHPMKSVEELSDGMALAQILHEISPQFFSDEWLADVKPNAGSNWRLKVSNMKKILKRVLDYHSQELEHPIHDTRVPDVTAIVKEGDGRELGRLLQLVLGCAVNCSNKQNYVLSIMSLEESVQLAVMKAIQELPDLLTGVTVSNSADSEEIQRLMQALSKMSEEKDVYAQRCHDLDNQVMLLLEERTTLQTENEQLIERLNRAESLDDPDTPAGRRYQQLQRQYEQLQEDQYKTENARDDLRIKVELLEKEFYEVQQKNEELSGMASECRQLRDEIYILRNTADKVGKYEATIANQKKKLEELGDLKGQVKMLEEKCTTYTQKNLDLEEEVKKSSVYKSQLETYKRQLQDLQLKNSEETKRADRAEFEAKRNQEKLATLQREKERLEELRDTLTDSNNELMCTSTLQSQPKGELTDEVDGGPDDLSLLSPTDLREQILRLRHENKKLKSRASSSEQDASLQTMLDIANDSKNNLECEVRAAEQRIRELEAEIEDTKELMTRMSSTGDSTNNELRKKLSEQLLRCRTLEDELETKKNSLEDTELKLQMKGHEFEKLQESLIRKENEMKEMEEKYKRYLAKAKNVIKQLDPKYNQAGATSSSAEVQALRAQLNEKEKYIHLLEKENIRDKQQRETEEALMISAFYNLGASVNRKAAEDRLSTGSVGQVSFLEKQRRAQTLRQSKTTGSGTSAAR